MDRGIAVSVPSPHGPRVLQGSWELDKNRLNRKGAETLSLSNQMIQFGLLQSAYIAFIWCLGAFTGIVFFLLQAGVAILMLEAVSYIEHYGLLRSQGR